MWNLVFNKINILFITITKLIFNFKLKDDYQNIAIYRFGSFGDSIVVLPALNQIRQKFPNSKITIYNQPETNNLVTMDLLCSEKLYDKIKVLDASMNKKEVYGEILENDYDLYIELISSEGFLLNLRKLFYLKLIGFRRVIGFNISPNATSSKIITKYYNFSREGERISEILNLYGIDSTIERYFLKDTLYNNKLINKFNLSFERYTVFVVKSKRNSSSWKEENWLKLGEEIAKKYSMKIIFLGAKSDYQYIQNIIIKTNLNDVFLNLAGKTTIPESASIIKNSLFIVSVDTGPMHLSYALNKKVFGIFSSRDYEHKWYPPEKNIVFRKELTCSYCFLDNCPYDNKCVNLTTYNEILSEIYKWMKYEKK